MHEDARRKVGDVVVSGSASRISEGTNPLAEMVSGWGASSVVGLRRKANEDRYLRVGTTFAVSDGMGGTSGGSEASGCAVESVARHGGTLAPGAPLTRWESLFRAINGDVRNRMMALDFGSAGCTLTLIAVESQRVVVGHVGDSRLYEYEPSTGELRQLTNDHNLRNELQARGRSLQEATDKGLPLAGLVSYIGMPDEDLRVDVFSWSPGLGARLLLCSDGVHGHLDQSEIADVLASFTPHDAAIELTERADAAGGRDNSTAVVVELL